MGKTRWSWMGVALVSLLASARARAADEPEAFGARHQLVLSAERLFGYTRRTGLGILGDETDVSLFGGPQDAFTLIPRLAFDGFVAGRLSVGGSAGFARRSYSDKAPFVTVADSSWIILGPRVGYAVPLGRRFDLWPRLGFTYARVSESATGFDATSSSYTLTIDVPLVVTITPHFFIDVAPTADLGLGSTQTSHITTPNVSVNPVPKERDFGLQCGMGGFF